MENDMEIFSHQKKQYVVLATKITDNFYDGSYYSSDKATEYDGATAPTAEGAIKMTKQKIMSPNSLYSGFQK